jgi:predicted aldo/keto reductase-like oxidoreductase
MDYRRLGRTNEKVSEISLGTEYLVDKPREEVKSVIGRAHEAGINYFDVFAANLKFRDNMRSAIEGFREEIMLAAHLGAIEEDGQYKAVRDVDLSAHYFEDFLTRYDTDYADVLFLHNSDGREDYEEIMKPGGLKDLALEYKARGKVKYIGLSGHTAQTAKLAVESGIVDVLMFPINIAGHAVPGKGELLRSCVEHDVGLIAMKIFAGGKLLEEWSSSKLEGHLVGGEDRQVDRKATLDPVKGIHYVLSQIGVTAVVPGCKNVIELEADLSYLDATSEERNYAGALRDIEQFEKGECVYCNHCLPCPQSIDIGATIRAFETRKPELNDGFSAPAGAPAGAPASECVECGDCEERCPFDVEVIPTMREAAKLFG